MGGVASPGMSATPVLRGGLAVVSGVAGERGFAGAGLAVGGGGNLGQSYRKEVPE
jgi:hypothetical protein